MRRLALVVLLLLPLLASACGGGGKSTSSTTAAPDPGADTMRTLIAAASKGDRAAIWSHLSTASQKRLGPTYPAFARGPAASIEQSLRPFAGSGKPLVSERLTDQFGVVAVRRGTNALALALRKEGDEWKAEIQGPVSIDIGGPQPGSRTIVGQIGVEVHAPGPPTVGYLWVDGTTLNPNIYPGRTSATIYGNLAKPLPPGTHTAVAFAQEGRDATALAWTFTATKS